MSTSPFRLPLAVVVATAVLLSGCSGERAPTPEEIAASEAIERRFAGCDALAADITATLQDYIDQFAPATDAVPGDTGAAAPSQENLQQAAEQFQRRRTGLGCGAREFQLQLTLALEELEGVGPLGRAVVAQVRDSVIGTTGPPATVTVAAGEDLIDAVHGAGAGARILLEPGTHTLEEPLVLLRGTTLAGAGKARTSVVSTAPGAVVLFLGEETLDVEGVTFEHDGETPASVLVVSSGSLRAADVALRGGVADEERSTGWGLVLGGEPTAADAGRTEVITDAVVHDNQAGGVVVVGDRTPAFTNLVARDNAACGVCYLGESAGTMMGGELSGNETGLSLAEQAAPVVTGVTLSGNTVAGLLADGASAGELTDAEVTGNGDVGLAITGDATLRVRGTSVAGHAEVGILVEGNATPSIASSTVSDAPIGLLARQDSTAVVEEVAVSEVDEAHVVFADRAAGSLTGGSCEGGVPGVVLLDNATTDVGGTSCDTVDQR